ncbi:hypothetical protein EHQ42_06855 [Leptospira levettii]|uniref:hypothetical protein n=1 Tax=Leptospira levettii TaxID=2023178 RepID=UPI001083530A|nr:hypothetical protein [Leptospira levettii]TGL18521.1 hypothetical protein EHQ42_06855 [Leptospira levettii]
MSAFFVCRALCGPAAVRDSQVAVAASKKDQGVLLFFLRHCCRVDFEWIVDRGKASSRGWLFLCTNQNPLSSLHWFRMQDPPQAGGVLNGWKSMLRIASIRFPIGIPTNFQRETNCLIVIDKIFKESLALL